MSYAFGDVRHRIRVALTQTHDIVRPTYDIVSQTYDANHRYQLILFMVGGMFSCFSRLFLSGLVNFFKRFLPSDTDIENLMDLKFVCNSLHAIHTFHTRYVLHSVLMDR
jgi:hypothetical protein